MKYLLPITNSELSRETVKKTIEQATEDAMFIIIHCVPDQLERKDNLFVNDQKRRESVAQTALQKAEEICIDYNADYSTDVVYAETIEDGIKQAESEYEPDKVILSHQNTQTVQRSITRNILRDSETPITVFTEQML